MKKCPKSGLELFFLLLFSLPNLIQQVALSGAGLLLGKYQGEINFDIEV